MESTSFRHIAQLAEILVQNDITRVIVSPGSRNAPLIIAFDSHPEIKTYVVHDERSAAFFAIGMADELKTGVAIVCTSGSAPLNYAPAIAEAYYRQVPLLVLTADRPLELIDQGDGQCIRQFDVYRNFIKSSCQIQENNSEHEVLKGLQNLLSNPRGPVHFNIPLAEPLYQTAEYSDLNEYRLKFGRLEAWSDEDKIEVEKIWTSHSKKLVIVGQMVPNQRLQILFDALAEDASVAVLVENTSNIKRFTKFIHAIDRTLTVIKPEELEDFRPEVLVSMGGAIISKKIKQFFRKNKPKHNWRVGEFLIDEDTYQSKTKSIKQSAETFLEFINAVNYTPNSNFGNKWKSKDFLAYAAHDDEIFKLPYSDLAVFDYVIDTLPEGVSFQMSNSSVVRYCQLFEPIGSVNYYANRGVSGIDGSTSTALGMAVANPKRLVVLVTGDISFFYDSNGLWNSYLPTNFRVILINNNGGGIFNIIDGPRDSNQNKMFVAPHHASAENICKAYGVEYMYSNSIVSLESQMGAFYQESETDSSKLIEVDTHSEENHVVLEAYFKALSKSVN